MFRSAALVTGISLSLLVAVPAAATPTDPPVPPSHPEVPLSLAARAAASTPAPERTPRPGPAWSLSRYRAQTLTWSAKSCTDETKALTSAVGDAVTPECATLRTPLDWTDLDKGSMTLHVSRVRHVETGSRPTTARTLFVNPGGPGGSAGPMTISVGLLKPSLRTTHDIVGVDPRGTGGSTPLACGLPGVTGGDSRDTRQRVRAAAHAQMTAAVTLCAARHKAFLPHITTANTVRDHDLVRELLGGGQADWYGVSAGSWMGAWYAHLLPEALDRVVLDANTQFTSDWRTSFAHFPHGVQRRFDRQFLPWMARQDATYRGGSTTAQVRAAYERVRAAAGEGSVERMRPDDIDAVLTLLMYDDESFPFAAQFIAGTDAQLRTSGTATPTLPEELLEAFAADPSVPTVRTAIVCNDTPFTRTRASLEQEFVANITAAPLTAAAFQTITGPCASWPVTPGAAPRIDGSRGPMKLMVQTEFDGPTPIEGALAAHAADARTRLLTVTGQGSHGGYLTTNRCVDETVTTYLQTGAMPSRDTTCAGVPLPGESRLYPLAR